MRNLLYWTTAFPILLLYGIICLIPILSFTFFEMSIYWSLTDFQKEYLRSAEKHLFGFIDDGGNLIDSIFERMFLK